MSRVRATIVSFGRDYGFARPDAAGPDIFVHRRSLPADRQGLVIGEIIECDVLPKRPDQRAPSAANVKVIN